MTKQVIKYELVVMTSKLNSYGVPELAPSYFWA
jgi:hypothetical protein